MNTSRLSHVFVVFGLASLALSITSCREVEGEPVSPILSEIYRNLLAEPSTDYSTTPPTVTGDYVKFSFSEGAVVTGDDWDVAFRGTTILVNGGTSSAPDQPQRSGAAAAYLTSGTMASVSAVDESLLTQDTESNLSIPTGSGNGWYNYSGPPSHLITPIAGKIIVIRTHQNRYAKMEILSYYKDAPANPEGTEPSSYYTFSYVYQPNEGVTTFE